MRVTTEQIGVAVFGLGVVLTALLIWMAVTTQQLPDWFLALATVL